MCNAAVSSDLHESWSEVCLLFACLSYTFYMLKMMYCNYIQTFFGIHVVVYSFFEGCTHSTVETVMSSLKYHYSMLPKPTDHNDDKILIRHSCGLDLAYLVFLIQIPQQFKYSQLLFWKCFICIIVINTTTRNVLVLSSTYKFIHHTRTKHRSTN